VEKDELEDDQVVMFGPRSYLELPDVRSWERNRSSGLVVNEEEGQEEDDKDSSEHVHL